MSRARWLQETKQMGYEDAYEGYQCKRLSQEEASQLLGVRSRTDQSHLCRHEESGLTGLLDKRLNRAWRHKAPVDDSDAAGGFMHRAL